MKEVFCEICGVLLTDEEAKDIQVFEEAGFIIYSQDACCVTCEKEYETQILNVSGE